MIHNTILPLLISLLGLPIGYLLSFLTAEEIRPGEKYFQWLEKILLIVFVGVLGYGFFRENKWILLIVLTVVGLSILGLDFTTKKLYPGAGRRTARTTATLTTYAFFVLAYLLLPSQQLLLASIIFLYGLPAGTMMKKI